MWICKLLIKLNLLFMKMLWNQKYCFCFTQTFILCYVIHFKSGDYLFTGRTVIVRRPRRLRMPSLRRRLRCLRWRQPLRRCAKLGDENFDTCVGLCYNMRIAGSCLLHLEIQSSQGMSNLRFIFTSITSFFLISIALPYSYLYHNWQSYSFSISLQSLITEVIQF